MSAYKKTLGDSNINRALLNMSIPAIVGMSVVATYSMVDTIFVGHCVGPSGIAGVFIGFPYQIFIMSVAMMLGVGGGSIISRALGEGNVEKAYTTLSTVGLGTVALGIVITLVSFLLLPVFLKFSGAKGLVYYHAKPYFIVMILGTVFFMVSLVANSLLRAEGKSNAAMWILVMAAGINIILDFFLIYLFKMGTFGASLATVIAEVVAFIYIVCHFSKHGSRIHFEKLIFKWEIFKETLILGFSSFINQVSSSFLLVVLNNRLAIYGGGIAIGIFSIYHRMAMLICMPVFGLAQGMQPLAGYHFGSRTFDKVKEVFHKATFWATVVTTIGFVVLVFFPSFVIRIFTKNVDILPQGKQALILLSLAYPLVGFQMIGSMGFMAIGKYRPALILNTLRQLIFLIPFVYILSPIFGLYGIWISFPISDVLAFVVTLVLYRRYIHKLEKEYN